MHLHVAERLPHALRALLDLVVVLVQALLRLLPVAAQVREVATAPEMHDRFIQKTQVNIPKLVLTIL